MDQGATLLRDKPGNLTRIAEALGITRSAVAQWKRIPAEYLPVIEEVTGIPRYELRPDICPPPKGEAA